MVGAFQSQGGWTDEAIASGWMWGPYQWLTLIATIGIVMTAAYILWALQRVFLGTLNEKYQDFKDISAREIFSLAPLLVLCIVLGVFPWFVLDWMEVSVADLMQILTFAG